MTALLRQSGQADGVAVSDVVIDDRDPERRYIPGHPDADPQGYVAFPRVNPAEEMVDLMGASRGYAAERGRYLVGERHDRPLDRLFR